MFLNYGLTVLRHRILDQPFYRPEWTDLWNDIVSCPSVSEVFNINITIKTGKPRSFMDGTNTIYDKLDRN